jgi:hypothetical protein
VFANGPSEWVLVDFLSEKCAKGEWEERRRRIISWNERRFEEFRGLRNGLGGVSGKMGRNVPFWEG